MGQGREIGTGGRRPVPATSAGSPSRPQEAMSKPTNPQVQANLSQLDVMGKLTLIALLAKFAPNSTQYAGNADFKSAADRVIAHGPTMKSAHDDAEQAKKAAETAANARDVEVAAFDGDFNILRAIAETILKTDADFHANGLTRQIRGAHVPLTSPGVTATPSKRVKGAIVARAKRITGISKYICAISVDPVTPTSWIVQNGTQSLRTITGLESGKGYWIKYCTERGANRSDWSIAFYCVAS
jgi:hypothetical protein